MTMNIEKLFKPYIVTRKNGQCQVLIPLIELDELCDKIEIMSLEKQGHSNHCACRQVWGDGECECDLYEKGYDPYAWQNLKKLK